MNKKVFACGAFTLGMMLAVLLCGGCSSTPWGIIKRNIENSRQLRVGMTKNEVLEVMGEPIRDESFCKPDLWFYYIEMVWGDGLTTEDECMPLVFENGKLIGWGNNFYIDYRLKRKDAPPIHNPERKDVSPASGKPTAKAPASGKPTAKAPASGKPTAKAPASGKPSAKAPASGKPSAKAPASGKPSAKAPASGKPSAKAPVKGAASV